MLPEKPSLHLHPYLPEIVFRTQSPFRLHSLSGAHNGLVRLTEGNRAYRDWRIYSKRDENVYDRTETESMGKVNCEFSEFDDRYSRINEKLGSELKSFKL